MAKTAGLASLKLNAVLEGHETSKFRNLHRQARNLGQVRRRQRAHPRLVHPYADSACITYTMSSLTSLLPYILMPIPLCHYCSTSHSQSSNLTSCTRAATVLQLSVITWYLQLDELTRSVHLRSSITSTILVVQFTHGPERLSYSCRWPSLAGEDQDSGIL